MAFGALNERLAILISADGAGAIREMQKVGQAADRDLGKATTKSQEMATTFVRGGTLMAGAAVILGAGLYKTAEAASALGEQANFASKIFSGSALASVQKFAKGAVDSAGMSERAALQASAGFGVLFNKLDVGKKQAADMSTRMVTLAADLASVADTSPEEAIIALSAALRGEMEPIRKYGVTLDDATLKQRALDMGLIKTTTGTLPMSIKIQAAYAEILEQTKFAQGDFADTSDSLANSQRKLSANMENLMARIGGGVVPIFEKATGAATKLVGGMSELDAVSGGAVGKFALFGTIGLGASGSLLLIAGAAIKVHDALDRLNEKAPRTAGAIRGLAGIGLAAGGLFAIATGIASVTGKAYDLDAALSRLGRTADRELVRTFAGIAGNAMVEGAKGMDILRKAAEENLGTFKRLAPQLKEQPELLAQMGVKVSDLDKIIRQETESQKRMNADVQAGADAINEQGDAAQDSAAKFEDLISAVDDLTSAELDVEDAMFRVEDARIALTEAQASGNEAESARKFLDLKETIQDASQAVRDKAEADNASLGPQEASRAGVAAQIEYLLGLARTLDPGSPLRVFLEQYIARLAAVPTGVTTTVDANTTPAHSKLDNLESRLRAISDRGITGFGGGVSSNVFQPLYERQMGGPIPGGRNQAVPILAHGGEYVLDAGTVAAIKRGAPSEGSARGINWTNGGGVSAAGGPSTVVVQVTLPNGRVLTELVLSEINSAGGPKISQRAIA